MPTLLLALLLAVPVDVMFEQTVRSGDGPPIASRVYRSGRKMRLEPADGGSAFVLRLDQGRGFRLDPAGKQAVEIDLERLRAATQLDLSTAGDLALGVDGEARSSRLTGTRTLAGHVCEGYRIKAASATVDVWMAPDVPVGLEAWTELLAFTGADQSLGAVFAELRRLPGFPLETRTRVTVLGETRESIATVTKLQLAPLPASLFEVPAGYQLEKEAPE